MTIVVDSIKDLPRLVGTSLGSSDWLDVDQRRIDTFAEATDDHQWIHVDVDRAKDGPFGGTIAHGYLTLSLLVPLWSSLLEVRDVATKVNYGLDKVRFPAPLPAGSRVRASATVAELRDLPNGVQLTIDAVVEREGGGKPVCVARPVFRYYA
ncbi:MaoC family dehydratase [Yinghuangia sp. YIM S09857]|uniref:MaoC family dehydratase n=1 Tax=Yinghuangia sp. YIM S09857 TaxID=3436929 RepID=UPI003F53957E